MNAKELAVHIGESMAAVDSRNLVMPPRDVNIYRTGAADVFEELISRVRFWLFVQQVPLADGEFDDMVARAYAEAMRARREQAA